MGRVRMANEPYPEQNSKPVAPEWVTHATENGAYAGAPALEQERNVHSELETTWIEANPTPRKAQHLGSRGGATRSKNKFATGEQQKRKTMAAATQQKPTGGPIDDQKSGERRGPAGRSRKGRIKRKRGPRDTNTVTPHFCHHPVRVGRRKQT